MSSDTENLDEIQDQATEGDEIVEEAEDTGASGEAEGQPRDEHGRFASAAGEEEEAEGTEDETVGGADDAPKPEGGAPKEEKQESAALEPEGRPFAVRALGETFPFNGAVERADGSVVFAGAARERLHQLLGRSILINRRSESVDRERAQLKMERASLDAYHKPLEEEWAKLKAARNFDEFQEIAADLFLNREVIDSRRELAKERAALQVSREPQQVSVDEQRDQVEREVHSSIRETFTAIQSEPWAKGLTADDLQEIEADVQAARVSFLVRREDGIYYNGDAVVEYAKRQALRLSREREKINAAARQAQAAAKKNASATVSTVTAPPGVGTAAPRKPAPRSSPAPRTPAQTKADRAAERERFQRWVETGRDD